MIHKNRTRLELLSLEERLTPSFTGIYEPTTDTWTLNQVSDDGIVAISIAAGTNDLTVDETFFGGGMATFGVATGNLTINLLDNSTPGLVVINDGGLTGNLSINLGSGDRFFFGGTFLSGTGSIGGNVTVTAGAGDQDVLLGFNPIGFGTTPVSIGGSANIDLGTGIDFVIQFDDLFIGGSFTMRNVNDFLDAPDNGSLTMIVGGNLNFYVNQENLESELNLDDLLLLSIGGNVTYFGGNDEDNLDITGNGASFIGGSVYVNLGNAMNLNGVSDSQDVEIPDVIIGGNLTVIGGFNVADPGVFDFVDTNAGTVIGGNVYINTGPNGLDVVNLFGTIGGSSVRVITGIDNDSVTYAMTGNRVRVFTSMSLGNDTFILGDGISNPSLGYLYVDFGFGADIFMNNFFGPYTFPVVLRNLP